MMEPMTQPDPSSPTFNPSAYEWALGYEFTPDPLGLGDEWSFIYQSMPYDQAVGNYWATKAVVDATEGGIPNIRNLGVYFTPPVSWQPFEVPPDTEAGALAAMSADTPNQ